MTTLDKNLLRHGVLIGAETGGYGTGGGLPLSAATDGVLAYETPTTTLDYADLGVREGISGSGSNKLRPVAPSARKGSFDMVHYFKGAGAAYSSSVVSTADILLRGLGMSAVVDTTPESEKWTYAPISTGLESLVAEVYTRGQKHVFAGGYVSKLEIAASGLVVPKWTASVAGIMSALPTDVAVPSITYPSGSVQNPKATNVALTLANGGQTYTAKVREWTFAMERTLDERIDQNLANMTHAGFFNGARAITFELTLEASTLTTSDPWVATAGTINPYGLFENEKDIAVALTVGGTQYNKFSLSMPTARLTAAPTENAEGNIATWGLSFDVMPSADGLEDEFTVVTA